MQFSPENLIWIDCEMTGLDPERDTLLEIATVITDVKLEALIEGPALAIHQPDVVLRMMDAWNRKHHGESGLTVRVRASQIRLADAERMTLEFIKQYVPPNISPMCGNSVCQDRRFLARYMPELADYFHYRNLDVSTLKELQRRWAPAIPTFNKDSRHLALADIHDSIDELKHYRTHFLNVKT